MSKKTSKPAMECELLRSEIAVLEALQRRGGITMVFEDDQLITAYTNDRKVRR